MISQPRRTSTHQRAQQAFNSSSRVAKSLLLPSQLTEVQTRTSTPLNMQAPTQQIYARRVAKAVLLDSQNSLCLALAHQSQDALALRKQRQLLEGPKKQAQHESKTSEWTPRLTRMKKSLKRSMKQCNRQARLSSISRSKTTL